MLISEVPALLSKYIGVPQKQIKTSWRVASLPRLTPDLVLDDGKHIFVVNYKSSSAKAPLISSWSNSLQKELTENSYWLLVVPFMSEAGRKFCEEHKISWMDLSGNAKIKTQDLFIHVEGNRNRFKGVGRPADVFAPKSSRIARQLLIDPKRKITQRELSKTAELDEGLTSRIVRKLQEEGFIAKDREGNIYVPNPALLLDEWRDSYDFNKHSVIKGHIASRSSANLLTEFSDLMKKFKLPYAATGLGAAWLYDHFANFRVVTFYLKERLNDKLKDEIGFRQDERGANTWLVIPKDDGVFQGSKEEQGVTCVHPVQVYLDLKSHPERAAEAAESLRKHYMNWSVSE